VTDLLSGVHVGVKSQGPWVLLWRDLLLLPDVSEAAGIRLSCLGAPPRRTRIEW
jgi:hypothetical protein